MNRIILSKNRDRLANCMKELVKHTLVMRSHFDLFGDRYSEREEKRIKENKARLLDTQNGISLTDI